MSCAIQRGAVSGVIDFEDTGPGDPVYDFCALAAEFGTTFVHDMLSTYRLPRDDWFDRRLAFHSRRVLFHELLYGIEYGAPECTDHAKERLCRAMASQEPIGGWLVGSTSETRHQEGFPTKTERQSLRRSPGLQDNPVSSSSPIR